MSCAAQVAYKNTSGSLSRRSSSGLAAVFDGGFHCCNRFDS
jgi:hypothetical protein